MKIIIKENYQQMSVEAALFVKKRILEKPDIVLGLASGETPLGLYKELIKMYRKGDLDFSKITTFNLDEYLSIKPSHPQSYHFYMQQNFFKHINIKKENIFILDGLAKDIEAHCEWYENKIKEKGGIDLQILGIGRNGHIGFNEPGTDFNSITRVVSLEKTTIKDNARFFKNIEEVPKKAITMGIKTILDSKECLLLASGIKKREIVSKFLKGAVSSKVPASALKNHKNVIIILDKTAAGDLTKINIGSIFKKYVRL